MTLDKAENNNEDIVQIASSIKELPTDGEGSSVGSSPSSANKSELPQMTVSMSSGNDLVVLGGKCDDGATVLELTDILTEHCDDYIVLLTERNIENAFD